MSGLFSVLSYLVEQRTREIGVRMALGAQARAVRRMVVAQGVRVVLVGVGIGGVVALASTRLLGALLPCLTLLVPGGMDTAFFDGRPEQYRPCPDAQLNDPAEVADAVLYALTRPEGCEVRELVVCASTEPSWP